MEPSPNKSLFNASNSSRDFTLTEGDEKLFNLKNKMRYLKVALLKEREGRDATVKKSEKVKNSLDYVISLIEQEVFHISLRINIHLNSGKSSIVLNQSIMLKLTPKMRLFPNKCSL